MIKTWQRLGIEIRDVKFGFQIVSDWPQMGQIRDFLRSVSVLKQILISPIFVPFGANLTQLGPKSGDPSEVMSLIATDLVTSIKTRILMASFVRLICATREET